MLTTGRLILREFSPNDWRSAHAYASDPDVVRYQDWGPNSEQQTRDFVANAIAARERRPRSEYELAVVHKGGARLIGSCRLEVEDPKNGVAMLGYTFARGSWGQGYASEAAAAMLAFGFTELDLHRVYATCDVQNIGSWRVMEKIGMQREARLREHVWQGERWRDSFVYGILLDEWRNGSVLSATME